MEPREPTDHELAVMTEPTELPEHDRALIKEARAYCDAVNTHGMFHTLSLVQFARLRSVHEGRPANGKWGKWAEDRQHTQGEERKT